MTHDAIRRAVSESELELLLRLGLPEEMQVVDGPALVGGRQQFERLRDRLTLELAREGFDSDYRLTSKGEMLERLIDKLFVA